MPVANRRVFRLLLSFGLCYLLWLPFHVQSGTASVIGTGLLFSIGPQRISLHILMVLALLAALILLALADLRRRRNGRTDRMFVQEAEAMPSGQKLAVVTVRVKAFRQLPRAKRAHTAASLARYLEGFIQTGELFRQLRQDEFGLLLRYANNETHSRRLQILEQDVRFLYMASYPALSLVATVGVCPLAEAQGAADALQRARTGGVPAKPGPDEGQRKKSA